MTPAPVELHIVSDATGETATRLVAALEAQFPEQPFEEVRHPRVETVDDLRLVVDRAKGRPAVVVYTIVKPELREAMRDFCRRAKIHYCDILGPPLASIAKISGQAAQDGPGRPLPARLGVLPPDRGDRVRGQVRRRDGRGARRRRTSSSSASRGRRRRRSRCTSATWATRPRTSRSCSGIEPPPELFEIDHGEDRRPDDRRPAAGRDPPGARAPDAGDAEGVRGAGRDLRRARAGRTRSTAGSAARCSTSRSSRSRRPRRAWSSWSSNGRRAVRDEAEHKGVKQKPPVPWWRWPFWGVCMLAGDRHLLHPAHPDLDRAAGARLGGRVPGPAPQPRRAEPAAPRVRHEGSAR